MMRKWLIKCVIEIIIKSDNNYGRDVMEYFSVQEVSDLWNISKRRIQVLCREGRISGAKMIGNMWVVPQNTEKPSDGRIKKPTLAEKKNILPIRLELKRLLKMLYKKCDEIGVEENSKREYILTLLASELCMKYLKEPVGKHIVYNRIYKDIKRTENQCENFLLDEESILLVRNYLYLYKNDIELDNVVSWAYQYLNKVILTNNYRQTQFFTEKYMIRYLVSKLGDISKARKIVDPCVGGGNFLVECYEVICEEATINNIEDLVIQKSKQLCGYDIDNEIVKIALVNIRIKGLSILNQYKQKSSFDIWDKIAPCMFSSLEKNEIVGSLAIDNRMIKNIISGDFIEQNKALGNAEIIVTNPPFATVKGMPDKQKEFLKENYSLANCDMCVSFMERINILLALNGKAAVVSQNMWMHLKSFTKIRYKFVKQYKFQYIINLGSGAFYDLCGEKANVSLLVFSKKGDEIHDNKIKVLNLTTELLKNKIEILDSNNEKFIEIKQSKIDTVNGFNFTEKNTMSRIEESDERYKEIAAPMQGTSTGNAKELVGYFWEHFNDKEWVFVSNGGGYCRWLGLNNSVVKWGISGEYIKNQKGSALRNVKWFDTTEMVFSDTGTAGLNVRLLLEGQIFIASGPGIRVLKGNKYAHLAFLNSRLAAHFVRTISPKLTIAAGYIGQIPIKESIYSSVLLEKNAKLCVDLKKSFLRCRPNNIEFSLEYLKSLNGTLEKEVWEVFRDDLTNELLKLEIENQSDEYIVTEYKLTKEEKKQLDEQVGKCAFNIKEMPEIELSKLDSYMEKLLDESCMLKRSRVSKNSLGCDGILEYTSKDLQVNPEQIVKAIIGNPARMEKTLNKYQDLLVHNSILGVLGYDVNTGISQEYKKIKDIVNELEQKFNTSFDFEHWILEKFNAIHMSIYKGIPFLTMQNGAIQKI